MSTFSFLGFDLKVFLWRVRFEPSEAEWLPYRIIPFTARRASLTDHMHLFCCTLCRCGFTHTVCLKAFDDCMTYSTFWITSVGSKELDGYSVWGWCWGWMGRCAGRCHGWCSPVIGVCLGCAGLCFWWWIRGSIFGGDKSFCENM